MRTIWRCLTLGSCILALLALAGGVAPARSTVAATTVATGSCINPWGCAQATDPGDGRSILDPIGCAVTPGGPRLGDDAGVRIDDNGARHAEGPILDPNGGRLGDAGVQIDPDGDRHAEGPGPDPNGGRLGDGRGIDPNGDQHAHGPTIDPNGGRLGDAGVQIDPDGARHAQGPTVDPNGGLAEGPGMDPLGGQHG